jgi:ABC-type Mn2+/Zn2+ transport system permease subunit/Mn-dependent DtxR family transcriptional regulator
MQDLLQIFQYEWAIRALAASSMVGLMCGILGCFIVLRNMSLIGDALAHAILPGVVFAFMIVGYSALGFFTGAVLAGLATALGITWIQQNVNTKNDAAIGIVFTAMFSVGVMGISWISRNDGVHLDLKDFLFGNVLGVSNQDLYLTAAVLVYVIISIIVFYRYLFVTTFQPVIAETMGISVKLIHYFLMLLLSFAVVASLQTVGVILVVAMLITPASTALLLSDQLKFVVIISALIGLASAVLGLIFAIIFETTPGPAMAVTATLIYLLAVVAAPKRGLIVRTLNKRKLQHRIRLEDVLKQSFRLQDKGELSLTRLLKALNFKERQAKRYIQTLQKRGLFEKKQLQLTDSGIKEAKRLVRAHRLWETYLSDKMGLDAGQIHDEAERYEHLLSDEILDRVDEELGFPKVDPHGSPIPTKIGLPEFPLTHLEVLQKAKIAHFQVSEKITAQLWQLGLLPNTSFSIEKKDPQFIEIQLNGKQVKVPFELARKINTEKL